MLKGVIFDMDGVIVDSHPVHKKTWRRFLELHGKHVAEEELNFIMDGRKRDEILRHFLGELSNEQIRTLGHEKELLFKEHAKSISMIEGLPEFLKQLARAEIKMAVASSGSASRVKDVLESLELRKYFPTVVTGDDVINGKPDPSIFRLASEWLQVQPFDALVFEDSVSGVKAARAAGIKCIGVATDGLTRMLASAGAIRTIPNYSNLYVSDLELIVS